MLFLLAGCGGGTTSSADQPSADQEAAQPAAPEAEPAAPEPEPAAPEPEPAAPEPEPEPEPAAPEPEPEPEPAAPEPEPEPAEPEPEPAAAPIDAVVFNDDFGSSIAPIFEAKCASCHNTGGPGAPHWQLNDASDLAATHEWISGVVETRYMPPWPASDISLPFHDDRSLRADEIDAIVAWSQAGAPLDVEASALISSPTGVTALAADTTIPLAEPYQGSTAVADDYRCFVYELGVEGSAWMQGYEFVPDQTQIVHHAIGYLAAAQLRDRAQTLDDRDEGPGWQCYGGSGLPNDDLFLGWAPGQLPTEYPEGSGVLVEQGDFVVVQIHYHFDTEAPADESSLRIDWADQDNLDPIEFSQFVGPAEIPCAADESGPLCDRNAALQVALDRFGPEGVLANNINRICGVQPEDFAQMTNGVVSSSCTLPMQDFGELVAVFGHMHEIGSAIRITLNPGRASEQVLLDIPDWSFDWQLNYFPVESIEVAPGDTLLLECEWDRGRRNPSLEPSYILWADGTNDEMCFATTATRGGTGVQNAVESDASYVESIEIPAVVADCLDQAGFSVDQAPSRNEIDALLDEVYQCASPQEIGEALRSIIAGQFDGLVTDDGLACLSDRLADRDAARSILIFSLDDATVDERAPVGQLVADCIVLSDTLAQFGFTVGDAATSCVDEAGRPLIVQAVVDQTLPNPQAFLSIVTECA